ncbi:MAG: DUF192 domain-containing protein [Patescibacteria group bacterium]
MKKISLIIIAIVILSAILVFFSFSAAKQEEFINTVKINDKEIKVEIAKTNLEQYWGLSGRKNICPDCGMLFVSGNKRERNFVMRDMMFPLDIVWIDNEKIIKIDRDLQPESSSNLTSYESGKPVDYVLEVNAGFCANNNIKIGDKIWINY